MREAPRLPRGCVDPRGCRAAPIARRRFSLALGALRVVGLSRALPGLHHRWRDPRGTVPCAPHAMNACGRHLSILRSSSELQARPGRCRPPPVGFVTPPSTCRCASTPAGSCDPTSAFEAPTSKVPFRPRGFAPPRRFSPRVGRRLVASCCRSGVRRVSDLGRLTRPLLADRAGRDLPRDAVSYPWSLFPVRAPRCRERTIGSGTPSPPLPVAERPFLPGRAPLRGLPRSDAAVRTRW
jgi:hypothetical protein